MVEIGKNITNSSKNPQFLRVTCALYVRCGCVVCASYVHVCARLCTNAPSWCLCCLVSLHCISFRCCHVPSRAAQQRRLVCMVRAWVARLAGRNRAFFGSLIGASVGLVDLDKVLNVGTACHLLKPRAWQKPWRHRPLCWVLGPCSCPLTLYCRKVPSLLVCIGPGCWCVWGVCVTRSGRHSRLVVLLLVGRFVHEMCV